MTRACAPQHAVTATRLCGRCLNPVDIAEAEYVEEPSPTPTEPRRTIARRFHRSCYELDQQARAMATKLPPPGQDRA